LRLIRQAILAYQQGNSDKVYEVDLCEVGPDQFVVNFRYGRRGATLRDGTKTATAVSEAAAVSIFEELVASKEAKGYRQPGSAASQAAPEGTLNSDDRTASTDDAWLSSND
jgi:predicted DNA-binding WGR domain protein